MDGITARSKDNPSLNPWLIIAFTGLVPLVLFLAMFFKWYQDRTDFRRLKSHFVQRQNQVMAYDAMEVSTGFGDLLEKAGRDVQMLSEISPTGTAYVRFFQSQVGDFTRYDADNKAVIQEPLPFYNQLARYNLKGDRILTITDGKAETKSLPLNECRESDLCDAALVSKLLSLPEGSTYYGKVLRYYTPEGQKADDSTAGLAVGYRTDHALYTVRIDYRHLRDHLTSPSFPYDPKLDLVDAYQKGNYLFIVDSDYNIITHPRQSNAVGIDKATGKWVEAMKEDSEAGSHPINIAKYERGVLKDYFARLLKTSFTQKGVDIFASSNLQGTRRILSVAPVFVSKGQYKETGIFGHVIVSCNVDYFEEPKEVIVPYY